MDDLREVSDLIPAKHALFILDCCFGGIVADRAAPLLAAGLTNRARQIICAGTKDQTVKDGGGGGHSVFTAALIDGLSGLADGDADNVIVFGELFNYVGKRVEAETSNEQEPVRSAFPDDGGGNVAFFPPGAQPVEMTAAERLRAIQLDKEELLAENERLSDSLVVKELRERAESLWPRRPVTEPRARLHLTCVQRCPIHWRVPRPGSPPRRGSSCSSRACDPCRPTRSRLLARMGTSVAGLVANARVDVAGPSSVGSRLLDGAAGGAPREILEEGLSEDDFEQDPFGLREVLLSRADVARLHLNRVHGPRTCSRLGQGRRTTAMSSSMR
jgi:hypothetical protein